MTKRLTEKQKIEIAEYFKNGKTIHALSDKFNCTTSTITRNLKKYYGDKKYKEIFEKNKLLDKSVLSKEISKNNYENLEVDESSFETVLIPKTKKLLASLAQLDRATAF